MTAKEMRIEELKERAEALLHEPHAFEPGMIVEWKPGLKNKKPEGPFVVVDKFEPALRDTEDGPSSPYFMEPMDLHLGQISTRSEEFILMCADSRRFQPVK